MKIDVCKEKDVVVRIDGSERLRISPRNGELIVAVSACLPVNFEDASEVLSAYRLAFDLAKDIVLE